MGFKSALHDIDGEVMLEIPAEVFAVMGWDINTKVFLDTVDGKLHIAKLDL